MKNDANSAKTIALKYLSRAPRSVKEAELKLKEKNIGEDTIEETINYLLDLGYLNDETFAKQWADSKIRLRLWGRNRIILGLRQKGIAEDIIKQVAGNTEEGELHTSKTALEKWVKRQGRKKQNEKLKQKAFQHLHSKGFGTGTIISAIKEILGKVETDEG